MQKEIMIGQIPVNVEVKSDEISGLIHNQASTEQGNTIPSASGNIHEMSLRNSTLKNECDEDCKEVNSAGQNSRPESSGLKRKRHYRHTKSQIEAMEALFKDSPHPSEAQRNKLASKLGLAPIQVRFWFQNKRTHTKSHDEHKINMELRAEKEKLVAENISCKKALANVPCPKCGGAKNAAVPEIPSSLQQLRLENARLLEQMEETKRITSKCMGKSVLESSISSDTSANPSQTIYAQVDENTVSQEYLSRVTQFVELNMPFIKEGVVASMDELIKKSEAGEQLWIPYGERNHGFELNEEEYYKVFPTVIRKNGSRWKNEGSMKLANVMASPLEVVEVHTDMAKWITMYPNIVFKAKSLFQLSKTEREATKDGDIQLVFAEFQIPCPVVSSRKFVFMRYCKQLSHESWAIVDVSLDNILPKTPYDPLIKCLKWPSGCIIQATPSGFSKVTWVEHTAMNDEDVHHLVEPIHKLGVVYGATKWISTLQRQCERIAYTFSETNCENVDGVVARQRESAMSVLKLSERMCGGFFKGPTIFNPYGWTFLSGDGVDDVRLMKKDNVGDTRMPFGVVLSGSLCLQLPLLSKTVFDYLRNKVHRAEWDIVCENAEIVQETFQIATGPEGNGVSVLKVHKKGVEKSMLVLQETSTEKTLSMLIFAPFSVDSTSSLLAAEPNLEKIGILPSGFTIIPTNHGTLLSACLQMWISPFPFDNVSEDSIDTVKTAVKTVVKNIHNALMTSRGSIE